MTREQAIALLRLTMDSLQQVDDDLHGAASLQASAPTDVRVNPDPGPVLLSFDDWCHRDVDRHTFVAACDQARRSLRNVQFRVLEHAKKLGVL